MSAAGRMSASSAESSPHRPEGLRVLRPLDSSGWRGRAADRPNAAREGDREDTMDAGCTKYYQEIVCLYDAACVDCTFYQGVDSTYPWFAFVRETLAQELNRLEELQEDAGRRDCDSCDCVTECVCSVNCWGGVTPWQ